jgi:hypothetical protein
MFFINSLTQKKDQHFKRPKQLDYLIYYTYHQSMNGFQIGLQFHQNINGYWAIMFLVKHMSRSHVDIENLKCLLYMKCLKSFVLRNLKVKHLIPKAIIINKAYI